MLNMKKIYEIQYDAGEIKIKSLTARETNHQLVIETEKSKKSYMQSGIGTKRVSKDNLNVVQPGLIIYTDNKHFGISAITDSLVLKIKETELELKNMKKAIYNLALGEENEKMRV